LADAAPVIDVADAIAGISEVRASKS
jgi:hypothetical protein